jgi:alpha-tubulin suppressor-like RCC1 family protein
MITSTTSGVWELDEVYAKIKAERWKPNQESIELFVWANNSSGTLGQNDTTFLSSPTQIPGTLWNYEKVSTGRSHIAALKTDSTLWVWGGNNVHGALGLNDVLDGRSSPTQVPGTQWSSISAAYWSTYAIKTDGTLWSWGGFNTYGSLGVNDRANYSSPIQVPGTQWSKVDAGLYNTGAIKTDGTLWIWGRNQHGESGLNDKVARSSPTQIPGTQWVHIDIGGYSTYAIKSDGTLWSWGYNPGGQLGHNNRTYYSSPVQIPGTQWASGDFKTNGQYLYVHLIKTDGTLWACGYNDAGVLGQNATTRRSSPTQIPGTQWSAVAGVNSGALAVKDDGTLWSWGTSDSGAPGQGDAIARSSPIQIPGTQWISVSRSNYSTTNVAIKQVFTY